MDNLELFKLSNNLRFNLLDLIITKHQDTNKLILDIQKQLKDITAIINNMQKEVNNE